MMARKILIDCDPGTDDAIALFMALGDPRLDVRLVTVAGGNVGLAHTLRNARALVGLTGKAVPVVAGAEHPLLALLEQQRQEEMVALERLVHTVAQQ